jgi:hypothetical protein
MSQKRALPSRMAAVCAPGLRKALRFGTGGIGTVAREFSPEANAAALTEPGSIVIEARATGNPAGPRMKVTRVNVTTARLLFLAVLALMRTLFLRLSAAINAETATSFNPELRRSPHRLGSGPARRMASARKRMDL